MSDLVKAEFDPQLKALFDNIPGGGKLPMGDPVEARDIFRQLNVAMGDNSPAADLASTDDIEVPGARGPQKARLYRPHGDGPFPTILFFHGGGFVVGDILSYDLQARVLAEKSGAVVLSSDYGLAPEEAFPHGLDDVTAITRWALANVDKLGGNPDRVAIAGDSAGGNLSAATTHELRDESPGLYAQILIYPTTDFVNDFPSRTENAGGPVLTAQGAEWFGRLYVSNEAHRANPRVSPLLAENFDRLPRALVITAGYDPLRDEGDAYAEKLAAAGVPVDHLQFETLCHGFFGLGPFSPGAADAIDDICDAARRLLA